ncbi:MAG: aldehyde ferredoxin oxidoreductase [Candidatus Lokiarchaeota archaeon]|nr:aldehyde ferredoxin oxidoreductase [Candidatus Lokiarchaeota archaeon]
MSDIYGYMGKILWVDLTKKELKEEKPDEEIYRKYLGGYGLGVYYIYSRLKPKCDPLGPDNIIGFCPGLMTGNAAPFTGRYMVCGKSPLTGKGPLEDGSKGTGGWGDANSGGYFSPAIKRAGYDAIFITGSSDKPVYLYIDDERKELIDADNIWGKNFKEADKILKEKHGKICKTAMIGVGGENQVLVSGIVNDDGRIAARSGLGAVLGAKKFKCICLKGKKRTVIKDKEKAKELSKSYNKQLRKKLNDKLIKIILKQASNFTGLMRTINIPLSIAGKITSIGTKLFPNFLREYGTTWFTDICLGLGDSPVKNFKGSIKDFPQKKSKNFTYDRIEEYKEKRYGCYSCPVQCGAILDGSQFGLAETHRPEYETIQAFGSLVMNEDLEVIIKVNEYLNMTGVDSISAGGIVAYTLECVENGLLKKEDFKCEEYPDGFLPTWEHSENILPLLKIIVNREGIGDVLANGVKEASKHIPNSEQFAINANGQELPLHDQRLMQGLGLSYLTDPTPGRHTAAGTEFMSMGPINAFVKGLDVSASKKPQKLAKNQARIAKFAQAFNAMGLCIFSAWCGHYPLFEFMDAFFGWTMDLDEFLEIGWRIQTLRQMFNAREGAIRHEVSKRAIGDPPLTEGPLKKVSLDLEEKAQLYYDSIGFTKTGIPKKDTLNRLNLKFCVKDLNDAIGRPEPLVNEYLESKD